MSSSELPDDPKEVFRYAVEEGFDAQNKDVVLEAFADSVDILQRAEVDELTPEQLWQEHRVEAAAFPDYTHNIQSVWRDKEMVFAQYAPTGTFENELVLGEDLVFEPNGATIESSGLIQARIEDGQITGWGAHWDKLDLFQQAGIVPPLAELADPSRPKQ